MAGKWYKTGFSDAFAGLNFDPPWNPGHRDHTSYAEGYADGERQAERNAKHDEDEPAETDCAHRWSYSGTAYGGDDDSYHGEGRCYCTLCGADGDA
jgi:hypothetical protein